MYLWLNDIFGYGVGIHGYSWDVDETSVTAYGERQKIVNGLAIALMGLEYTDIIEGEYEVIEEREYESLEWRGCP